MIEYKGGKCERCGYNKNMAALEFHHVNPEEKEFPLDARRLSNTHIDRLKKEVDKCMLLCANCHREIHHPDMSDDKIEKLIENYHSKSIKVFNKKRKTLTCPVCGKEFDYVQKKIFCSPECREAAKKYPDKEEVRQKYQELKSQQKVADYYGLTRRIIRRLLK
jgi:predicted nucleic acid-binding Zn ribbon protein